MPFAAIALALAAVSAAPQKPAAARVDVCPWCKNDPALMARAGVVSHGPSTIGPGGSAAIVRDLPASQWVFLETAHLRWASSLGTCVVDLDDKKRVLAELARLREVLPDVPEEPKKLDPFLRLHLFAMKGEDFYARFQKLLAVTDADFPESRTLNGPFMGNGRFLGEKDKFEVVLHGSRATHTLFTAAFSGVSVPDAVLYHLRDQHKMIASIPAEDSDLRKDRWLFPHVVHCLSHLCLRAYKHFSYDSPPWLDEGLALCMEKEIDPASTTNEGGEGGKRDARGPKDWNAGVRKLVAAGKELRLAQLLHMNELDEFDESAKLTAWSMVRFLVDEHGEKFAAFLGGVKGQLDEQGQPTGRALHELQRKLLDSLWNWTPVSFDEAWKASLVPEKPADKPGAGPGDAPRTK